MNKTQIKRVKAISTAIAKIQDEMERLKSEADEVMEEVDEMIQNRSETWQQGDAGMAANEELTNLERLRDALENANIEDAVDAISDLGIE